jgi:hypothetical protein
MDPDQQLLLPGSTGRLAGSSPRLLRLRLGCLGLAERPLEVGAEQATDSQELGDLGRIEVGDVSFVHDLSSLEDRGPVDQPEAERDVLLDEDHRHALATDEGRHIH